MMCVFIYKKNIANTFHLIKQMYVFSNNLLILHYNAKNWYVLSSPALNQLDQPLNSYNLQSGSGYWKMYVNQGYQCPVRTGAHTSTYCRSARFRSVSFLLHDQPHCIHIVTFRVLSFLWVLWVLSMSKHVVLLLLGGWQWPVCLLCASLWGVWTDVSDCLVPGVSSGESWYVCFLTTTEIKSSVKNVTFGISPGGLGAFNFNHFRKESFCWITLRVCAYFILTWHVIIYSHIVSSLFLILWHKLLVSTSKYLGLVSILILFGPDNVLVSYPAPLLPEVTCSGTYTQSTPAVAFVWHAVLLVRNFATNLP